VTQQKIMPFEVTPFNGIIHICISKQAFVYSKWPSAVNWSNKTTNPWISGWFVRATFTKWVLLCL